MKPRPKSGLDCLTRAEFARQRRVQSSGFRVQGSGFRVQGAGFRIPGLDLDVDHGDLVGAVANDRHGRVRPEDFRVQAKREQMKRFFLILRAGKMQKVLPRSKSGHPPAKTCLL